MTKMPIAAMTFSLTLLGTTAIAGAANIKVVGSVAVKGLISELVTQFERASGDTVITEFEPGPFVKKKIDAGETFDVAILTPNLIDELIKNVVVDGETVTAIARTGVGVAVRAGTPQPDLSSVDALKSSLRAASSIGFTDPSTGAAGAVYVVKMIERLGMTDELKSKIKTYAAGSGGFPKAIIDGEVEIWLTQISEIVPVAGIELAGPLPRELQFFTVFTAGVATNAKDTRAVRELLKYFTSPSVAPLIKAKGMEPG
jgi:molybdate transport system substrate-binding protein